MHVYPTQKSNPKDYNMSFLLLMFHSHTEVDTKVKSNEPVDAAALIAEALKRKFAHRYRHDSEREEKEDFKLPVRDVIPETDTPLVRAVIVLTDVI